MAETIPKMRIHEMREAAGLSIKEMSERMGVSFVTAYRWDVGQDIPSSRRLPRMADVLECTTDELYGRAQKKAQEAAS